MFYSFAELLRGLVVSLLLVLVLWLALPGAKADGQGLPQAAAENGAGRAPSGQ